MKVSYISNNYHHILNIKPSKFICETNGKGLWSSEKRKVNCSSIKLYLIDDESFNEKFGLGELRVYFSFKDWNTRNHGLIYTDPAWLKDLRDYLISIGFTSASVKSIDYSEQGMQGDDYVSLDTGKSFNKIVLDNLPSKIKNKINYK